VRLDPALRTMDALITNLAREVVARASKLADVILGFAFSGGLLARLRRRRARHGVERQIAAYLGRRMLEFLSSPSDRESFARELATHGVHGLDALSVESAEHFLRRMVTGLNASALSVSALASELELAVLALSSITTEILADRTQRALR